MRSRSHRLSLVSEKEWKARCTKIETGFWRVALSKTKNSSYQLLRIILVTLLFYDSWNNMNRTCSTYPLFLHNSCLLQPRRTKRDLRPERAQRLGGFCTVLTGHATPCKRFHRWNSPCMGFFVETRETRFRRTRGTGKLCLLVAVSLYQIFVIK